MDAEIVRMAARPCAGCGRLLPTGSGICPNCPGPVALAQPIDDTIRVDATVAGVTLHAGYLATIVALDRRRPDSVEIVTCPLDRAALDASTPFDAEGTLKPGRGAEGWPPLARLWAPERVLAAWPSSVRRRRWSVAADSSYDPSLVEEPAGGLGAFWKRRDAVVVALTVVFIVLMALLIMGTTAGHLGPSSTLSPLSPNG